MHIEWPTAKQLPTWMIRPQQIDAVFGPGLCDGGLGPCNHHHLMQAEELSWWPLPSGAASQDPNCLESEK